jgi:hypothetical protein
MLHNEHLAKADESYEIRHDNNGNVIHVFTKDGEAIVFPTLNDFVLRIYFGAEVERFYIADDDLSKLYDFDDYNYYSLKAIAEKMNELPPPPSEVNIII